MARWRGCTPGRRDTPDATLDNRSREERHARLDAHRSKLRGQLGVVARLGHERWQPECRHPAFDRTATYRRVMGSCPDCRMAKPDRLPIRVASGTRTLSGLQSRSPSHGTMIVEPRSGDPARVDRANASFKAGSTPSRIRPGAHLLRRVRPVLDLAERAY